MKLLDTYAVSMGAKIGKPFIFEQFFPLTFEKYITFQAQTKYDSKDFSYWQDVINMIFPVLDKLGIKIVQIGGANEFGYQYISDLRGQTDLNQLAYIVKGSLLHIGSDSLGIHLASSYDIPIVGLYSISQSGVSGPHFGSPEKQILFDAYLRTRTGKPSYADKEHPKCVNLIKPEEIANAIFKLLGIDMKIPFETIHTGDKYNARIVREFIPVAPLHIQSPNEPIEIRMDILFNEQVLVEQLKLCKAVVITNKRIDKNILTHFKSKIAALAYVVEENDEPAFLDDIKEIGLQIIIISRLPIERIIEKRINYYHLGRINHIIPEDQKVIDNFRKDLDTLYFKSNKVVAVGNKLFMGSAMRTTGEEFTNDFNYQKVVDCPEFWEELPFTTIVKKI